MGADRGQKLDFQTLLSFNSVRLFIIIIILKNRALHSQGWSWIYYMVKENLELWISLPPPPKS